MTVDLSSYKVLASELSSSSKFDNLVQAIEDALNALPPSQLTGYPSDASKFLRGDGAWAVPGGGGAAPSGTVVPFAGSAAPTDWLLCDGAAVSRTTYAALFAVIASTYGGGDGSTTFNVPDLRGRVAVGKGTNAAVSALGNNDAVAVANRRPQHRHTAHTHNVNVGTGSGGGQAISGPSAFVSETPLSNKALAKDGGSGTATDALDAPAYIVLNYIIKT